MNGAWSIDDAMEQDFASTLTDLSRMIGHRDVKPQSPIVPAALPEVIRDQVEAMEPGERIRFVGACSVTRIR